MRDLMRQRAAEILSSIATPQTNATDFEFYKEAGGQGARVRRMAITYCQYVEKQNIRG